MVASLSRSVRCTNVAKHGARCTAERATVVPAAPSRGKATRRALLAGFVLAPGIHFCPEGSTEHCTTMYCKAGCKPH
eukprot:1182039-Prorocentrum_minimum.AAC.2